MTLTVGVPKEIKTAEHRVAMTPDGVRELETAGVAVFIQAGAGADSAIADADYRAAGATIVSSAEDAWAQQMVVKVKEPQDSEFALLRDDLTLVHLPPPRGVSRGGESAARRRHDRDRVRDGAAPGRGTAVARTDERGRGTASRRRQERTTSNARTVDVACSSAARRACARLASSCSAPGTSAGTRRGSQQAWRPRSCSSTRTSTAFASSIRSTAAASSRLLRTEGQWSARWPRQTS